MYDSVFEPERRLAVALGTPELTTTGITVEGFTGDTVSVSYTCLPANRPHRFGNFVAIWEATMIPWADEPMRSVPIPLDGQKGSVTIDGLTVSASSYIVGYSVAKTVPGICASAILNAGGLLGAPMNVQLGVNTVGTTSLSIHYGTLAGYLPSTYGNRIVLYPGYASPFNPPKEMASVPIPTDANVGDVAMNGIAIGVGLPYTLVYYMRSTGPDAASSAAAVLTFDTDDFAEQHPSSSTAQTTS